MVVLPLPLLPKMTYVVCTSNMFADSISMKLLIQKD